VKQKKVETKILFETLTKTNFCFCFKCLTKKAWDKNKKCIWNKKSWNKKSLTKKAKLFLFQLFLSGFFCQVKLFLSSFFVRSGFLKQKQKYYFCFKCFTFFVKVKLRFVRICEKKTKGDVSKFLFGVKRSKIFLFPFLLGFKFIKIFKNI